MRCLVSNDVNCIIDLTFLEVLKKDSRYDMKDYRLYLAPVYWDRVRSSRERGGGRDFETQYLSVLDGVCTEWFATGLMGCGSSGGLEHSVLVSVLVCALRTFRVP